ncbi:valine--tRNA ligase [Anopheles gambiae]|uniref:valine--tRNA ligase n=1 Tax=Anopheles coluzzii TaxID=1518534 RepID=A0A6E8VQG0_ANOCL|nr:valine--tRNA ligase-like [Anopheles coluzzii]XP_061497439.1 valine--tRNA ligase [Anopheles gambiae]
MLRVFRRNVGPPLWPGGCGRTATSVILRQYGTGKEIASAYKPSQVERSCESGTTPQLPSAFNQTRDNAPPFNVLLPPPNVTGELHLGHALTGAIQDALVRQARLSGRRTTWIPGMDHAGIATQVVVEKRLLKERNLTRHDLGRERFLQEVMQWKVEKEDSIRRALKKLGCSMDWSREYFTMDAHQSVAVKEAFVQLFDRGLIYRDRSLINWSCTLESAISDVEVENVEISGPTEIAVPGYSRNVTFGRMVDIAYKVQGSTEEIVVSTTRPETFLGDVAVAVHPDDGRYSHLRNKVTFLWHPVRKEEIPLIFDGAVDRSFGTGAVKITPAHDRFDFELGRRHHLATVEVIDERGRVQEHFGPFTGMPRYEAREALLEYLAKLSLLRGIKPHTMLLPLCSRSKDVVELLLRPQWFVRCREMAQRAMDAVREGKLEIVPNTFEREWFRWLDNCHDWCISRQLWWGHRIPAYCVRYDGAKERWIAARSEEEAREKFAALEPNAAKDAVSIEQDPDVLDTWFSSGLLPFSSTGWPGNVSPAHYPLQLMETGHDILFFWVARMVMLGQELTGKLPFERVLLHGIICDEFGRKMSKSLGNVIKPDHVIHGISLERLQAEAEDSHRRGVLSQAELGKSLAGQRKMFPSGIPECGIDALRFTLCSANVKNHFIHFNAQEAHTNKLFFNKIWQATRYTLACAERFDAGKTLDQTVDLRQTADRMPLMDRWILSRLGNTVQQCREAFASYNFHLATAALKTFFYSNFCDVYLETTKINMKPESSSVAALHCAVLKHCLTVGLRQMEPFTPYLAQELLTHLCAASSSIAVDLDHDAALGWVDPTVEESIECVLQICQHIRQAKNEYNPPIVRKHNPILHIYAKAPKLAAELHVLRDTIQQLTHCNGVVLHSDERLFGNVQYVVKGAPTHDCLIGIVAESGGGANGAGAEASRKMLAKLDAEIEKLLKTIGNEGYKRSASESVQKRHQEKLDRLQQQREEMLKMAS